MKRICAIFIIITVVSLTSCKDQTEGIDLTVNTHRMKTIIERNNGYEIWKCDLSYLLDKVIETSSYNKFNNSWIPEERTSFTYSNNRINALSSIWYNNEWYPDYGNSYLTDQSMVKEYALLKFSNNEWINLGTYLFTYKSNRLVERKYVELMDGEKKIINKLELNYRDNNIIETRYYTQSETNNCLWLLKQNFDYSHDGITDIYTYEKDSENNWKLKQRTQLKYINNQLSEANVYEEWPDIDLWHLCSSSIYLYDNNNYLYKVIECDGYETEFIYEEGHGNASLFYNSPLMQSMNYPTLKKGYPLAALITKTN